MKTLVACLILLYGAPQYHGTSVSATLDDYIHWTTTGKSGTEDQLFDNSIRMTYQPDANITETVAFGDYELKIQNGASTVHRLMRVDSYTVNGSHAEAMISDNSDEHNFSLIHHLTLKRKNDQWTIQRITIRVGS